MLIGKRGFKMDGKDFMKSRKSRRTGGVAIFEEKFSAGELEFG